MDMLPFEQLASCSRHTPDPHKAENIAFNAHFDQLMTSTEPQIH